jgi:hypothetical protein
MSARRSVLQRTAVLTATAVIATGLAGALPAGAAGPADPGACAALLSQVLTWPGGVAPSPGGHRVSDAYESHLLRQPPCRPAPGA